MSSKTSGSIRQPSQRGKKICMHRSFSPSREYPHLDKISAPLGTPFTKNVTFSLREVSLLLGVNTGKEASLIHQSSSICMHLISGCIINQIISGKCLPPFYKSLPQFSYNLGPLVQHLACKFYFSILAHFESTSKPQNSETIEYQYQGYYISCF